MTIARNLRAAGRRRDEFFARLMDLLSYADLKTPAHITIELDRPISPEDMDAIMAALQTRNRSREHGQTSVEGLIGKSIVVVTAEIAR